MTEHRARARYREASARAPSRMTRARARRRARSRASSAAAIRASTNSGSAAIAAAKACARDRGWRRARRATTPRRCSAGAKRGWPRAPRRNRPRRPRGRPSGAARTAASQRAASASAVAGTGVACRVPAMQLAQPPTQAHRPWRTRARPAARDAPAHPCRAPNSRAQDARRACSRHARVNPAASTRTSQSRAATTFGDAGSPSAGGAPSTDASPPHPERGSRVARRSPTHSTSSESSVGRQRGDDVVQRVHGPRRSSRRRALGKPRKTKLRSTRAVAAT